MKQQAVIGWYETLQHSPTSLMTLHSGSSLSTPVLEVETGRVGLYVNSDKCKVVVSSTWGVTAEIYIQVSALQWKWLMISATWAVHTSVAVKKRCENYLLKQHPYMEK